MDRPPEEDRKNDIPELFRHLHQYVHGTHQLPELESRFFQLDQVHPAVCKVGLQYLAGDNSGGNSRCIAVLHAFRDAIKDYSTPPEKDLFLDLTAIISSYDLFLKKCRPLSIGTENAIEFLKNRFAKLHQAFLQKKELGFTLTDSEATASLLSDIDDFIYHKIILADKLIVDRAVTKIPDEAVLLTYGSSSVVEKIFVYAHEIEKQFRVVVVDSHPKLEGQSLLRRLVAKGLCCTYTHIGAVSNVMHEVKRVFLGASSVLSNGTVYSRAGTACVAMVAHKFCKPVLICCEAYKFHERAKLDSICYNELGDPVAISKVHHRRGLDPLSNCAEHENLELSNLVLASLVV